MAGKEDLFGFSGCDLFRFRLISRSSSLRDEISSCRSFSTLRIVIAYVGVTVVGSAVVEWVLELEGTFGLGVGSLFGVIKLSSGSGSEVSHVTL